MPKNYRFIVEEGTNLFEVNISVKGGNYILSNCSCAMVSYKKCRHVMGIIAGSTKNLLNAGIEEQKKLQEELYQSKEGVQIINRYRVRMGMIPFCEKCSKSMETANKGFNLIRKLISTFKKRNNKVFYCTYCGERKTYSLRSLFLVS
jgi:ribosomal protein L34E